MRTYAVILSESEVGLLAGRAVLRGADERAVLDGYPRYGTGDPMTPGGREVHILCEETRTFCVIARKPDGSLGLVPMEDVPPVPSVA